MASAHPQMALGEGVEAWGANTSSPRRLSMSFRRPSLHGILEIAEAGGKKIAKVAKVTADTLSPRRGSTSSSNGDDESAAGQIFGTPRFQRSSSDLSSSGGKDRSSRRLSSRFFARRASDSPSRVAELSPQFHIMKPYLNQQSPSLRNTRPLEPQSAENGSPQDDWRIQNGNIRQAGPGPRAPIRATEPIESFTSPNAREIIHRDGTGAGVTGLSRESFLKSDPGVQNSPRMVSRLPEPKGMPPLPPRPKKFEDEDEDEAEQPSNLAKEEATDDVETADPALPPTPLLMNTQSEDEFQDCASVEECGTEGSDGDLGIDEVIETKKDSHSCMKMDLTAAAVGNGTTADSLPDPVKGNTLPLGKEEHNELTIQPVRLSSSMTKSSKSPIHAVNAPSRSP